MRGRNKYLFLYFLVLNTGCQMEEPNSDVKFDYFAMGKIKDKGFTSDYYLWSVIREQEQGGAPVGCWYYNEVTANSDLGKFHTIMSSTPLTPEGAMPITDFHKVVAHVKRDKGINAFGTGAGCFASLRLILLEALKGRNALHNPAAIAASFGVHFSTCWPHKSNRTNDDIRMLFESGKVSKYLTKLSSLSKKNEGNVKILGRAKAKFLKYLVEAVTEEVNEPASNLDFQLYRGKKFPDGCPLPSKLFKNRKKEVRRFAQNVDKRLSIIKDEN